ncbi:MAG: integrin [Thiohalomonadaceae bacterium]
MIPKHCNPSPHTILSLALGGLLLAGCGGGGGGGGSSVEPPAAPTLHLSVQAIKTFAFTWDAVDGATHYTLRENANGFAGYSVIAGADHLSTTHYDHVVPLHMRASASYILQACNSAGCTDSAPVAVAGNLAGAIGYFKASNTEAHDWFGYSVALSEDGTTLAVGAPVEDSAATGVNGNAESNAALSSGAVYVFTHVDGRWSQQAYLKASNTEADDLFGYSLAISADGNTLAVGAHKEDSAAANVNGDGTNNAAADSGAVYVFTRTAGTWSQQAYVKAWNPGPSDYFGATVALSGDGNTLAVGAPEEDGPDNTATNAGAVYIYNRTDGVWSGSTYARASNAEANDYYGMSVALSSDGNTLAVGAWGEDSAATGINGNESDNSASLAGAVYVITQHAGSWSQQAYIKASNTEANDWFGYSVALSGDGNTLAVGAWQEDSAAMGPGSDQSDNSALSSGAVYVFHRGSSWEQEAYIKPSNTGAGDFFGRTVDLSADGLTLVAGAYPEASSAIGLDGNGLDDSATESGAAYVFVRYGNWQQQSYLKAKNTQAYDRFGIAVAVSGNGKTIAVGASEEESAATGVGGDATNNLAVNSGAVYLY